MNKHFMNSSQGTLFKTVKFIKNKEELKNFVKLEVTKQKWKLNENCNAELQSLAIKGIIGKTVMDFAYSV